MPRRTPKTPDERSEHRRAFIQAVEAGGMPTGEAVREARLALDFTQATFAQTFGLTRRQVAEIESGAANPTAATLNRIAKPFGMTLGFVCQDPSRRGSGTRRDE